MKIQLTTVISLFFLFQGFASAQITTSRLFSISRSTNANIVCYDARLSPTGGLIASDPLDVYWTMDAQKGEREELTWFEKQKAYGYSVVRSEKDLVIIKIEALESKQISIFSFDGVIEAEMEISQKRAVIESIFVKTTESFIPSVEYIQIKGIDRETGKSVQEQIIP